LKQVTAAIIANDEVMPGVYLIWLESSDIEPAAQPGQFVMVRCGDYLLPRPLSIHRLADKGGKLALLFTVMGKGTHWLSQRKTGDNLDLLGPLGNGFSIQPASRNLLLMAGGIGIAPLYFAAQEAVKKGCSVKLLYGTPNKHRYPEDLLSSQIELVSATEDGSVGRKGMVTDIIPEFADWADQIFACGPLPMYRDMARRKQQLKINVKSVQVSLEVRMGCGLGVCYGCTVKAKNGLKQVCKDGPVFDLDDTLWDELADI
jgi:dihydroorotate dehydrogenase electron transfer subunit